MTISFANVKKVIAESIVIAENELKPQVSLENEIQLDSFEWVKLAADIEKNIGISIGLDNLKELDTLECIYKKIVEEKTKDIIATMFLSDKSVITADEKLMDMDGVDSQNVFQIFLNLEKEFEVVISDSVTLKELETIKQIADFVYESSKG